MNAKARQVECRKLSVPQMAKEWGVSANKVKALISSGELRAINLATTGAIRPRYAIDRRDVEAFERSRLVVPVAPVARRRKSANGVKDYFPD